MKLLLLTWPRIDMGRATMIMRDTKNGERRSVPITGHAFEVLRSHAKVIRLNTPRVFPRVDGCRPVDIRHAWYEALR